MPTFRIRIINNEFDNSNEIERPSADAVRADALKGALQIGVDEVCNGTPFFGAEIRIEEGDQVVERLVVAVGVSSLR